MVTVLFKCPSICCHFILQDGAKENTALPQLVSEEVASYMANYCMSLDCNTVAWWKVSLFLQCWQNATFPYQLPVSQARPFLTNNMPAFEPVLNV